MMRAIFLLALLAVGGTLPSSARADLVCEADIVSLDFGTIAVVDGQAEQTSGPVTISCSGGEPEATVHACIDIGAGSGGGIAGQTLRYMTGTGAEPLEYQLTARNSFSGGGRPWEEMDYKIALDADGNATVAPTIYAEVTSSGAEAEAGSYSANFDAGADVAITYGETACDEAGATSSFAVAALIGQSCTVSVTNMNFGIINQAVVAAVDQTATISVTCTLLALYKVSLGYGNQPVSNTSTGRRMANGAARLGYGMYRDSGRSLPWGNGLLDVKSGTGLGGPEEFTVYGRIFGNQTAVVGHYADSIVVTVTY